jgi:mRNA interferase MazF
MKRGEVWWVNFDGGEMQKQRPAVIISNDASNKFLSSLISKGRASRTLNVARLYPSEAYVNGKQHKAMTDQLTTVSKLRLSNKIGHLLNTDIQNKLLKCN